MNSINGNFIVLKMKSFGPPKVLITCRGKKVPFIRKNGHALLVHRISKIIIILDYYELLAIREGKIRKDPFFYDSICLNSTRSGKYGPAESKKNIVNLFFFESIA
jgi:hypothetical protein